MDEEPWTVSHGRGAMDGEPWTRSLGRGALDEQYHVAEVFPVNLMALVLNVQFHYFRHSDKASNK